MVQLTETAIGKVREILDTQEPKPAGLRIAVVGGGCSGFSYSMAFENSPGMLDKTYSFDGLKVFVDQASLLYLDGAQVDYVESMEGSGFKFNNPNTKSTCGCGVRIRKIRGRSFKAATNSSTTAKRFLPRGSVRRTNFTPTSFRINYRRTKKT